VVNLSLYVDIKKKFDDFDLAIKLECEDDVTAILGGSGCGKSLTLRCIAGIVTPDSGRIVINGQVVFDSDTKINIPTRDRGVGYLFQNYALFPTMTVFGNIASVIKKPKAERVAVAEDIIAKFKLEGVKNLYPREISGGQSQRVALARMLVTNPKIIMLDEPFSALDTHLRWHMEQEMAATLGNFSGSTIFVSHDRDEAYRLSHKIAIMDRGRLDCFGHKQEIFDAPKTRIAAMMTGCKNISAAKKLGENLVRAVDWGIDIVTDEAVEDCIKFVGIRAHHLQMASFSGCNNFDINVHKIINEPFEDVMLFTFEGEAQLQMAMPKDVKGERKMLVHIPHDKIMLLK